MTSLKLALVALLVTGTAAMAQTGTVRRHSGRIESGRTAKSTGAAVRDQSFIGSGGRRGESGWMGSGSGAGRYRGPVSGGTNPKEAGAVGDTGTGH